MYRHHPVGRFECEVVPSESEERPSRGSWVRSAGTPGERTVLDGLAKFDLTDVFRLLERFPRGEKGWYRQRRIGGRFDHVFTSRLLCSRSHGYRRLAGAAAQQPRGA